MINSAGCGDTFLGVFAAYYVEELNLQKALVMASVAAGINATRPETRGCPERTDLETVERLSRQSGFTFQERQQS
jgi:sugar/nucleoside kinase (ribokinase family)